MDKAIEGADAIHRVRRKKVAVLETVVSQEETKQQALAMRIWNGQSPDVAVIDRVARIATGLKAQGLPLDVSLPHADAAKYMENHK